jgi:signal transduction histidine kinase
MKELHDLVAECEAELVDTWLAAHECGDSSLTERPVEPRLEASLERLGRALTRAARPKERPASPGTEAMPEEIEDASPDAGAAVHAFGVLHGLILDVSGRAGLELKPAEHRALCAWTMRAVALAIADERRQRRKASRRIAHELRNPLGSALMALTLLRSHVSPADGARLADTLERNLKRLERVIEEQVAGGS